MVPVILPGNITGNFTGKITGQIERGNITKKVVKFKNAIKMIVPLVRLNLIIVFDMILSISTIHMQNFIILILFTKFCFRLTILFQILTFLIMGKTRGWNFLIHIIVYFGPELLNNSNKSHNS